MPDPITDPITIECCFCKKNVGKFGNNPEPLKDFSFKCCDGCNMTRVIPARILALEARIP
jgi:hypothetical protein